MANAMLTMETNSRKRKQMLAEKNSRKRKHTVAKGNESTCKNMHGIKSETGQLMRTFISSFLFYFFYFLFIIFSLFILKCILYSLEANMKSNNMAITITTNDIIIRQLHNICE